MSATHNHPRPYCGQGCPAFGDVFAKYPRRHRTAPSLSADTRESPAEPRTAAGRDLLATAYLAGDAASEGVSLLDAILAIEAEAAAPAGLDVEALALALGAVIESRMSRDLAWTQDDGKTIIRLNAEQAGWHLAHLASTEYARLLRQRGER